MSIVAAFGIPAVLVREATDADLARFWKKPTKSQAARDAERRELHMYFVAEINGSERIVDLAELRADGGWKEIVDEAAKIQPALRSE